VSQPARALPAPTTASGSVYYLYDLAGNVVTELSATGGWNRTEIYAGGKHVATYSNSTTYFDHVDWLGTERARTDAQGDMAETCTGLPYGDDLSCSGNDGSPLHFTGKQSDSETGNDYFGARYYGSGAGRFMSSDWSSVPVAVPYADLTNPQTLNLYAIVRDNPETFADLDGHCGPDHVPDCKDNATTANGALAAAGEGYPDPQKRGDGLTKSPTQQAQQQYTATILGQNVPVSITSGTAAQQKSIRADLDAAVGDINGYAGKLSAADIKTIHNIKSITVNDQLRTGVNVKTGAFNLRSTYILAPGDTTAWLASAIAHDAYHVTQYQQGLVYNRQTAAGLERAANAFQMRVGATFGLTRAQLNYLKNDTHTLYNTVPY
jgi:RHS repeat-associated protein